MRKNLQFGKTRGIDTTGSSLVCCGLIWSILGTGIFGNFGTARGGASFPVSVVIFNYMLLREV